MSKELDLDVVKELLGVLREQLDREDLKEAARAELRSEVKTIEAQTESPQPKPAIIRESLTSARRILESVAASSAGQLITRISSVLLDME